MYGCYGVDCFGLGSLGFQRVSGVGFSRLKWKEGFGGWGARGRRLLFLGEVHFDSFLEEGIARLHRLGWWNMDQKHTPPKEKHQTRPLRLCEGDEKVQ